MKKERVIWDIAGAVWWARIWRSLLLENLIIGPLYFLIKGHLCACWLLPLVAPIEIWAVRESLILDYKSFAITIRNRSATAERVTADAPASGRVSVRTTIAVWWAQCWRYFAALALTALAVYGPLLIVNLFADIPGFVMVIAHILSFWIGALLISIWATRESLVDDYKSFQLKISPRDIPVKDVSNGSNVSGADSAPRILVIVNDPYITTFVANGLKKAGHMVEVASNGLDGLALATRKPFDVAIIARRLPGSPDGLTVLETLRAQKNSVPVLCLLGEAEADNRDHVLKAGADDCLLKPFSRMELVARVEWLVRRRRDLSPVS
jgi:CheY-like chemotaxis protein